MAPASNVAVTAITKHIVITFVFIISTLLQLRVFYCGRPHIATACLSFPAAMLRPAIFQKSILASLGQRVKGPKDKGLSTRALTPSQYPYAA